MSLETKQFAMAHQERMQRAHILRELLCETIDVPLNATWGALAKAYHDQMALAFSPEITSSLPEELRPMAEKVHNSMAEKLTDAENRINNVINKEQ